MAYETVGGFHFKFQVARCLFFAIVSPSFNRVCCVVKLSLRKGAPVDFGEIEKKKPKIAISMSRERRRKRERERLLD